MSGFIELYYQGKFLVNVDSLSSMLDLRCWEIESIKDIQGLDRLVNLRTLHLGEDDIRRIDGLDNLVNLEELAIWEGKIAKIEGLDKLVNLERLDLCANQITRIEGLDALINLKHLDLSLNPISKVEGLENLEKLETIVLEDSLIPEQLLKELGDPYPDKEYATYDAWPFVEYCRKRRTTEKSCCNCGKAGLRITKKHVWCGGKDLGEFRCWACATCGKSWFELTTAQRIEMARRKGGVLVQPIMIDADELHF